MMPDREKVIEALVKARTAEENYKLQSAEMSFQFIEMLIELLKQQETQKFFVDESGKITPLPVVVRCKDCRWGDRSRNGKGEEMILCYNGDTGIEDGYLHEPDWFCAEGERKDS